MMARNKTRVSLLDQEKDITECWISLGTLRAHKRSIAAKLATSDHEHRGKEASYGSGVGPASATLAVLHPATSKASVTMPTGALESL